jgi:hypothetical protein
MNQTVPGLDPKLAETYNRVMGTPTAAPQAPKHAEPATQVASPTVSSPTTAAYSSSKKGLPWWIFLVLGIVFFAGYTFFWVSTLGLSF